MVKCIALEEFARRQAECKAVAGVSYGVGCLDPGQSTWFTHGNNGTH